MSLLRTLFMSSFLCAVAVSPSYAGFEFSGGAPVAAAKSASSMPQEDAPMPVVPAAPVQAEPLTPSIRPADMITEPLAMAASGSGPIYLKRPPANGAAPAGGLVINPYPLQAGAAVHGNAGGVSRVEHAMMEETGRLQTVAVPGNTGAGVIARAGSVSYDSAPSMEQSINGNIASIDNAGGIMTPMPGGEGPALTAMMAPQLSVESQNLMPLPIAPAYPQAAAVIPNAVSSPASPQMPLGANNSGFNEAVGFGKELPLALALSQVVPADYAFSFDQNVNAGATVSWQGGKPWDAVLRDMLQPIGMRAVISGKQVIIQKAV